MELRKGIQLCCQLSQTPKNVDKNFDCRL